MIPTRLYFVLSILLLITLNTDGQELTFGDVKVVEEIKKKTSAIYESSDQTSFFLTSQKLIPQVTNGLSIVAYRANGKVIRVITSHMTADGQSSIEWYYDQGKLIFVYDVFEFFNESPNKGTWKNFKDLYSRESRYYFSHQKLGYHKHIGRSDIDKSFKGMGLQETAAAILAYLAQQ